MHKSKLVTYQVMYGKDKKTPAIFLKSYDVDSLLDVVEYLVKACANKGLVLLPSHSTWEDNQREGLFVRSLLIQAYSKQNYCDRPKDEVLEDLRYQVLHRVLSIFNAGIPGYYFNCNGVRKNIKQRMDAAVARLRQGEVSSVDESRVCAESCDKGYESDAYKSCNSNSALSPTLSRAESVSNALRALGINPKTEELPK